MKKIMPTPGLLRHANSYKESKREDHFSYFQSLEQKLLQQSDKLTNLIGKSPHSDTRSHKASYGSQRFPQQPQTGSSQDNSDQHQENEEKQQSHSSMLLHNYLLNKKSLLGSSKSQYFPTHKEKQSQLQRKYAYNLTRPRQEYRPEQEDSSPSKSQKIHDHLKKTSSTTGSSAIILRTIDKIKKISQKGTTMSVNIFDTKTKQITIQDFKVIKFLEEGQFGSVYLAQHKQTNFLCALKKIQKKIFEGEAKFINQLIRQIKIQTYLDHPNIVQLYSFFADEDHLYLILQLCCGGNVYSSLQKQGRFPEDKVRIVLKQVSHAIEFMHDSDIIHRDIKPQNILFHQAIVKVCDFGWSIHSPLMRDTRCGTPLYSSPEVVQNQQYDNKIDVWNIGILAYELLCGRVPFQIRTEDDLVKVVDQDIYFPKNIQATPLIKDFILKCLNKNPKQRLPMTKLIDHQFIHR